MVGAPRGGRFVDLIICDMDAGEVTATLDGKLVMAVGKAGSRGEIDIGVFDDGDAVARR